MGRTRAVAVTVSLVLLGGLSAVAIVNFFVPEGTLPVRLVNAGYVAGAWLCSSLIAAHFHWRTGRSRARQIQKHLDANDLRAALPKLLVMVADCERVAGPQAPITMTWRHCLAYTQYELGHITDALRVAKINLDARAAVLGRAHPDTRYSQHLYEALLREIGE